MEYPSYFDIPVGTLKRSVPTDELDANASPRRSNPKRVKRVRRFSLESMTAVEEDEDTLAGRRNGQQKCDDKEWIPEADPYEVLPDLDDDTDGGKEVTSSVEGCIPVEDPSDDSDTDGGGAPVDMPFETPTEVPLASALEEPVVESCGETNDKGEVDAENAKDSVGNGIGCASDDPPVESEHYVSVDKEASAAVVLIGTVGRSRILGNTIAYRRAMRAHAIEASSVKEQDVDTFQASALRKENEAMTLRQPFRYRIREEDLEQLEEMIAFGGYLYQVHGPRTDDGFLEVVVWLPWVAGQVENWAQMQERMTWASQGGTFW